VSNYAIVWTKYRLAVPFAENNFGPFEHIVFVIVLLESPLKTLFTVLFASLYLQICICYQYISISCPTVSSKWVNPNRKYDWKLSKQCDACIVWPWKGQKWFARSYCTYTREFYVIPATGASYWPIIAQCTQFANKTQYLEKFKINISTRRIQTKFCTRKRLNTESILHI
jgi:hypothetical protein